MTFARYATQERVPVRPGIKPGKLERTTYLSYFRIAGKPQPQTPKPSLGIDLAKRGQEVQKLLFSGFGQWIYSCGYDPEDVLQEIYKGVLTRNSGKCPFDPSRASFGHYVHMLCGSVLSNYHRRMQRERGREQVGVPGFEGGVYTTVDVASGNGLQMQTVALKPGFEEADARRDLADHIIQAASEKAPEVREEAELALRALPLLQAGYTPTDIATELGVPRIRLGEALDRLRTWASEWSVGG